jgi:rSAM/selenodomain-associated transferase 1
MVGESGPVVVAVLTRAPSRGGKSRLFADLGRPPDASLLSALLLDTLDGASLAGTTRVVAVEPAEACAEVGALVSGDVRVMEQATGTLGERMRETLRTLFAEGAAAIVLIGSDLPDITPDPIARAVSQLARDPGSLVLGPAADGGYYLIAATRVPEVFDGIEWGSPRVLEQTRAAAAARSLQVHLLDPVRDVDTKEDLLAVAAARTREWVDMNYPV